MIFLLFLTYTLLIAVACWAITVTYGQWNYRKNRKWLLKNGFPLSIDSVAQTFAEDDYSAKSSAIYREAFVNPQFNEEAKDALASLCTSTFKLSYSDKKTALAVGESIADLQELVNLPAPGFGDLGHKFEPPKYRAQMRSLCEIVQLHGTFCLRTKDIERCVGQIGLFTTILRHLSQMPIPGTYSYAMTYSRALFAQMKLIAKFVSEDTTPIQMGLTAAEAIAKFESPWKILPVLFANQLDIISELPGSAAKVHRMILETDTTRKAMSHSLRKPGRHGATCLCIRSYRRLMGLKDPAQAWGMTLLNCCDNAEPDWDRLPSLYKDILRFEYPDPRNLVQQYLTFETLRRVYVTAFRVASAMAEKVDWKLSVQIDGSDIDPFSGHRFVIRTTSRSVKVIADCPDYLGIHNVKGQRMTLRLDVFEALSK